MWFPPDLRGRLRKARWAAQAVTAKSGPQKNTKTRTSLKNWCSRATATAKVNPRAPYATSMTTAPTFAERLNAKFCPLISLEAGGGSGGGYVSLRGGSWTERTV